MLVKKYSFEIQDKYGDNTTVYGKIEKEKNLFYWNTSHLTKPQDSPQCAFYHPSRCESDFSSAEHFLKSYIKMMDRSKVIQVNDNY